METARKPLKLIDTRTEVSPEEKIFLVQGSRKLPIYAESASKYSLFFRYADKQHFADFKKPVNLLLQNNGNSVQLGPCRIVKSNNFNGHSGCIIFTHEIYDVEHLLKTKQVRKLQTSFKNLSLILARKEKIRKSFKDYTADLSFDLSVYNKFFDDFDMQCHDEPEEVKESLQNAIFASEGKKFMGFLDEKVEELGNLVTNFSQMEHQAHGFYFRKQLWKFLLCCPLMERTNLKPRGYAGDSEIMRMIYFHDYCGKTSFAKLMHKHAVETPAANSVRNRIKLINKLLRNACTNYDFKSGKRIKVLSVGSGPALELGDILRSSQDCKKFHFILLDQDSNALSEASDLICRIEGKLGSRIRVDYLKGSVRRLLSPQKLLKKFGQFDFIYSLGLFDYLTDPVAKAVLKMLCQFLKNSGEMLIGNFHVSNRSRYHMEYWGDWYLIHRSEKDLSNLLPGNLSTKSKLLFEDTGNQMFIHFKNQPNPI